MHEAFWNGLFDVRWEEAPLGPEAIRLVQRLRERGYAERTCRDPLPARKVKAAGTPAKTSSNGSKTSEPPKVMFDLPRAFRTADLWLIHAADCFSRYSSWTCCGVRY
jgi:hypothetical protein